jgi:hypothetical protein
MKRIVAAVLGAGVAEPGRLRHLARDRHESGRE